MPTIGLILGSARANNNARGLTAWLESLFNHRQSGIDPTDAGFYKLVIVDPHVWPHPLGPIVDPTIAAKVKDPSNYASPAVQQWSSFVSSCAGFIILTPQYNWGYPGELKNSLDHLFYEWKDKPVSVVTYGGHGGGKCAAQLRQVLEGALGMKYIRDVNVTLPSEYIRGTKRVDGNIFEAAGDAVPDKSDLPDFMAEQNDNICAAIDQLIDVAKTTAV